MALKITDFIEQVDGISTDDIPLDERERINDALANVTGGEGGEGGGEAGPVNEDAILVSKSLDGRAGFTSIQDAIDGTNPENGASGAGEDDTIFVEPSEYAESVTIDVSGLTLKAADGAEPTIDGEGEVAEFEGVVSIESDDVTVEGFKLTNSEYRGIMIVGGSSSDPQTVTIRDNTITGSEEAGIQLGESFSRSTDSTIESNTIRNNGDGIAFVAPDLEDGEVTGNVTNNTIGSNNDAGLKVTGGGDFGVSIESNQFTENDPQVLLAGGAEDAEDVEVVNFEAVLENNDFDPDSEVVDEEFGDTGIVPKE